MAEYQLRSYRVAEGRMAEFVEVFRRVVEARREHGFDVVGAWTTEDDQRFVWVCRYDGPGTFAEASERYYASPERKAVSPDPASFLDEVETAMINPVDL